MPGPGMAGNPAPDICLRRRLCNFGDKNIRKLVTKHAMPSDNKVKLTFLSQDETLLRQLNYVMFLLAFGDLSLSASLRTIAGIAAEIVPAIREMEAQWAPRGWEGW
jgi:hypothetical protein